MGLIAQRLGLPEEEVRGIELLSRPTLADANTLFDAAFQTGESNPKNAQILLAAALLARSQATAEGRLAGTLAIIAQLVAKANPMKTLGPEGWRAREELLPSGWRAMSESWEKTRYAWREGLTELLDVSEANQGLMHAASEMTRLSPAEPEPTRVNIQEQFPAPMVAFGLSVLSLAFTLKTAMKW